MNKQKERIINVYRMSTPTHVKKSIEQIINNLENCGRAFSTNGDASRVLSRHFRNEVDNEEIFFQWNTRHRKSVIVTIPTLKIQKISKSKVKLIYDSKKVK